MQNKKRTSILDRLDLLPPTPKDPVFKMFEDTYHPPTPQLLTRYQYMQYAGLLSDFKAACGCMFWELEYAIGVAIKSYGIMARNYVWWVFECEWDASIEYWIDYIIKYRTDVGIHITLAKCHNIMRI